MRVGFVQTKICGEYSLCCDNLFDSFGNVINPWKCVFGFYRLQPIRHCELWSLEFPVSMNYFDHEKKDYLQIQVPYEQRIVSNIYISIYKRFDQMLI